MNAICANDWTLRERAVAFTLAATSIWCLLVELYGWFSMRAFAVCVFGPATALLVVLAIKQRWRAALIGAVAGLAAAVAYDVFRLPFVYSKAWGLTGFVPALPLFKVFPMFGAMLLGTSSTTPAAHVIGWIYHFSNGLTFGVMFAAMVGSDFRGRWWWAILLAVGLELAMLFTPYPQAFGIKVGAAFVAVTLTAHLIFGVVMGRSSIWLAAQTRWG